MCNLQNAPSRLCFFRQRQQHPHCEPPVLPVDGHAAAVLLGQRTEAFQVVAAVGAFGGQTVRTQFYGFRAVIFKPEHDKAVLDIDRRSDEPE